MLLSRALHTSVMSLRAKLSGEAGLRAALGSLCPQRTLACLWCCLKQSYGKTFLPPLSVSTTLPSFVFDDLGTPADRLASEPGSPASACIQHQLSCVGFAEGHCSTRWHPAGPKKCSLDKLSPAGFHFH